MDCIGKQITLDSITDTNCSGIESSALTMSNWALVRAIFTFLRQPRQFMERLSFNRRTALDLVPLSIHMLIKHCNDDEERLQEIVLALTTKQMKGMEKLYRIRLFQEPAILCAYLNPQISRCIKPVELSTLLELIQKLYIVPICHSCKMQLQFKCTRTTFWNCFSFRA